MPSLKVTIAILFATYHFALAAPAPSPVPDTTNQVDNALSGGAGHALGGSVTHAATGPRLLGGIGLVKLFSDNAGNGGSANSGPAFAGALSNLHGGSSPKNNANTVGNAYSGTGGDATGGSVNDAEDALITLFSGNAGKGGSANSGLASSAGPLRPSRKLKSRFFVHPRLD